MEMRPKKTINKQTLSEELGLLYQNKDFQTYLERLQENKEGVQKAIFHYNMGTAYLKMENWVSGRLHLEKARKLGVVDGRLKKNLVFVKSKLAGSDIDDTTNFFEKGINTFIQIDFQYYLFLFLLVFSFLLLLWRKRIKRSLKPLPLILGISSLSFLPRALATGHEVGIVMKDISPKEGPNAAFEEMPLMIPKGSKVVLGKKDGSWYLVKYPSSLYGWVAEDVVEVL